MRKACLFLLVFYFTLQKSVAGTVDIRLLSDLKSTSVIVSITSGKYLFKGDGKIIPDTLSAAIFEFNLKGDSIRAKTLEKPLGTFKNISLTGLTAANTFKLKSISPVLGTRSYDDELYLTTLNQQLMLINHVDIEKYVAGVVEAESGTIAGDEFYKVQAILCRTYVLANIAKHSTEGFNLCDQVHCQAFKGKTKDEHIFQASKATKDLVVVDNDLRLIPVTFCSNCGGQTANPEDVWGKPVPCLRSI
ncbi:MAG TPA: SpoIID/LytB domain-containing protein, partial [Bacteroidia bacterium]|nr:SpoIID/LytB domain-containing protein [Bacteroidia bacterium]